MAVKEEIPFSQSETTDPYMVGLSVKRWKQQVQVAVSEPHDLPGNML